MNKKRRELLKEAYRLMTVAEEFIQTAVDEEQDSLDNMPENLLDSEKCEKMETAIEDLENALDDITAARELISDAMS